MSFMGCRSALGRCTVAFAVVVFANLVACGEGKDEKRSKPVATNHENANGASANMAGQNDQAQAQQNQANSQIDRDAAMAKLDLLSPDLVNCLVSAAQNEGPQVAAEVQNKLANGGNPADLIGQIPVLADTIGQKAECKAVAPLLQVAGMIPNFVP